MYGEKMSTGPTVFMLPTFQSYNKYCSALIHGIKAEGIDVSFSAEDSFIFPFFDIVGCSGLPQIVHLHWIDHYTIKKNLWRSLCASLIYISGLLLLRSLGVKIVWTVHDYINLSENFSRLDILIRRFTAKLSNAIIVHTQAAGAEMANAYKLSDTDKSKINSIPHGHFMDQYPNTFSQTEARLQLGLGEDVYVYSLVGYIRPYKGILPLIEAFKQLDGDNLRLIIAGMPFDLSFGRAVRDSANGDSRIYLYLEFIEDEDLQIFFNSADVMVFPYTRSFTSGSLMLAMSFAKSVVISDCPFVPEVLPPEGGLVYLSGNREALMNALRDIQRMDVVSIGKKNMDRARVFNWQSIAESTVRIYRDIV